MRRCSLLGVPAQTALALSDQWPSIHGAVSQSTRSPGAITRPVASQPPVAVASPVVTVRIAGTRRPASLAIDRLRLAATSASLAPGSRELLDGALHDVGQARGAPDRIQLDRELDAPRAHDELVDLRSARRPPP